MRKYILVIPLIIFTFYAAAQNVNIPDINFKTALLADPAINTNADTEIQVSEAIAFDGIMNVSNLGITDLTGVEAFTNIISLNFSNNAVVELLFTDTMSLTYLNGNYNDLNLVSTNFCPNIINLILRGNELDSINLLNNKAVLFMVLLDNNLTQVNLDSCTNLGFFDGGSNDLTSIDFSNNLILRRINIVANNLTSIDVSMLTELEDLNVTSNDLTNLDVSQNLKLEALYASFNAIGGMDLTQNTRLTLLNLVDCEIETIDLSNNVNLETLSLVRNDIEAINVSNNLNLTRFEMSENPIVELDLSRHNLLTRIESYECPMLQALNFKNGNNANVTSHDFTLCPLLSCISVDNVSFANTNFTNKDATTSYSLNCNYCFNSYGLIDTGFCSGETFTSPSGQLISSSGVYYDTLVNNCSRDSVLQLNIEVFNPSNETLAKVTFCEGDTADFYGTPILSSGIFNQMFTSSNSCDSVVSQEFEMISLDATIIRNGMNLSVSNAYTTYEWYLEGVLIPGENTSSLTLEADGMYYVVVGDGICTKTSDVLDVEDFQSGIVHQNSLELALYPNPVEDILRLQIAEEVLQNIAVYDIAGTLIQRFNPELLEIDLSNYPSGIYLLKVSSNNGLAFQKIIKK